MEEDIVQEVNQHMDKAMEAFSRDLASIRTGRASTNMLSGVRVEYYGTSTPLNQVSSLSVPEPRLIVIKPYEQQLIPLIEKAIRAEASLGLNPSNDGTIIRVPIPELTGERRREYTKIARHRAEEARVAVRHARREGLDFVDASVEEDELTEDEGRHIHELIQKLTDKHIAEIDEIVKHKEKEIMEV
ncbi:MAG: ribosome recycling factor [Candidatus Handelsmanbacteria bacterium]|nr:ribosome recycling factor [Candidatus Handelsmanbacteria bacterium]